MEEIGEPNDIKMEAYRIAIARICCATPRFVILFPSTRAQGDCAIVPLGSCSYRLQHERSLQGEERRHDGDRALGVKRAYVERSVQPAFALPGVEAVAVER